jgi:hypothetical protein
MRAQRSGLMAVAVVTLAMAATPAAAQLCTGIPLAQGQTSVALRAWFPDGANIFGFQANNRIAGPLTVGLSYDLTSIDYEGSDNLNTFGGHVYYDLPVAALADAGFSFCPTASAYFTTQDDVNLFEIPIGVGVGGSFEVSDGIAIAPYAIPQLWWSRVSFDGSSSSSTDFGFTLGGNVLVTNLHFGALLRKVADGDVTFGVQGGIVF